MRTKTGFLLMLAVFLFFPCVFCFFGSGPGVAKAGPAWAAVGVFFAWSRSGTAAGDPVPRFLHIFAASASEQEELETRFFALFCLYFAKCFI